MKRLLEHKPLKIEYTMENKEEQHEDIFNELSFTGLDKPFVNSEENTDDALVFLKNILKKANVRNYTCINNAGYSQLERDIVDGIKKFGHYEAYNFHTQQSQKDNWISVSDRLPNCYQRGEWDGLKSDEILAEDFDGNYFVATCYSGQMDGSEFFDWYDKNDFSINQPIRQWMKIPN